MLPKRNAWPFTHTEKTFRWNGPTSVNKLIMPCLRQSPSTPCSHCQTSTSTYGTGAVIWKKNFSAALNQELKEIRYYSYTFNKAHETYATAEKEALAVVMAFRYFTSYLEGRTFKLIADNRATHLLNFSQPKGRLARWIAEVQQFAFGVAHRPAQKLSGADMRRCLHILQTEEVQ